MDGRDVWRIARRPHALDRLGVGARDAGGRWNHPGTGVIYTGCTSAIAALEKFIHLAGVVPADLVLVRVVLPEGFSVEQPAWKDLPRDWDLVPPGTGSMDFGTQWAKESRTLVLYVPSALLREETNVLINPSHPEFAGVKMKIERPFTFDSRMHKSREMPAPKKKR